MKSLTMRHRQDYEEHSPAFPLPRVLLAAVHLFEMYSAVAAVQDRVSEALFCGPLIAIRVEAIVFEF